MAAWNRAPSAVFGNHARGPARERNILTLVFAGARHRTLLVDWESEARRILARFRADYGRHAGDPAFATLAAELSGASPEFRRWWPEYRVEGRREGRFVAERPDLKLVIFTALREAATAAKLRGLLDHS